MRHVNNLSTNFKRLLVIRFLELRMFLNRHPVATVSASTADETSLIPESSDMYIVYPTVRSGSMDTSAGRLTEARGLPSHALPAYDPRDTLA